MKIAPAAQDEAARIASLEDYEILDTPPEESFDRITRLAGQLLDAPIALVSLIDTTRQWFKSAQGLETRETPREWAFCSHAILQEHETVVLDASADARFRDNPLVVDDPHIRFYAGSPLISSKGYALGTLCVIDRQPRSHFTRAERIVLSDLAAIVMELLNLRLAGKAALQAIASHAWSEARLEKALERAELGENLRDELICHLGHEMRTPLSAVSGFADMIASETHGPVGSEKYLDYAGEIMNASRHMIGMIDEQLAQAREGSRAQPMKREPIRLRELVDDVLGLLAMQAQLMGIELNHAGDDAIQVAGDFRKLKQVLINVVGNAIKYSLTGGKVSVSYQLRKSGGLALKVTDRGIGIAPGEIDKLFTEYRRAENAEAAEIEGTGLGLAISRQIMEEHGGGLRLLSTLGKGTTAVLELPADRVLR